MAPLSCPLGSMVTSPSVTVEGAASSGGPTGEPSAVAADPPSELAAGLLDDSPEPPSAAASPVAEVASGAEGFPCFSPVAAPPQAKPMLQRQRNHTDLI